MSTPIVPCQPRIGPTAWVAAALVFTTCLAGCGRDEGASLGKALERANREMLEKAGWGVRCEDDLEWLTRLGRGDTVAWEIVVARKAVLDVQIDLGPGAQATVAVPVEAGHHVHVVFRPRLGESGLVSHRKLEPGKSWPLAWTSWNVSNERWGACLSVLAPCNENQRIDVTAEGKDRVEWDWLDGQFSLLERPFFRSALGGTVVEGTPMGALAIPAAARITGQAVGVLPGGIAMRAPGASAGSTPHPDEPHTTTGMSFPRSPSAFVLLTELTWSTRSSASTSPVDVGTWRVRASLRTEGGIGSGAR